MNLYLNLFYFYLILFYLSYFILSLCYNMNKNTLETVFIHSFNEFYDLEKPHPEYRYKKLYENLKKNGPEWIKHAFLQSPHFEESLEAALISTKWTNSFRLDWLLEKLNCINDDNKTIEVYKFLIKEMRQLLGYQAGTGTKRINKKKSKKCKKCKKNKKSKKFIN